MLKKFHVEIYFISKQIEFNLFIIAIITVCWLRWKKYILYKLDTLDYWPTFSVELETLIDCHYGTIYYYYNGVRGISLNMYSVHWTRFIGTRYVL